MKPKFWCAYLSVLFLLSGLAYVAISDETDVPLALSDAEMSLLRGTGPDQKCLRHRPGCDNSSCKEAPKGQVTHGSKYSECFNFNGWYCNEWGEPKVYCRIEIWTQNCKKYSETIEEEARGCSNSRM